MPMVVLSWCAAVVACLAYGAATVLQSVGARRVAGRAGVHGVALIFVQLPYLLGLCLDGVGLVGNFVALQRLPLFLVQAIITGSVGVTALMAHWRGAVLQRRDWTALAVLGAGLVLLSAGAGTERPVALSATAQWWILAGVTAPAVAGLLATRLPARWSSAGLAVAAGVAWTGVAVAGRGLSGATLGWHLLLDPLIWSVVTHGLLGLVLFSLALQRGSVTVVAAVTFVLEMVLPSALGLLLLGDTVRAGWGIPALIGFLAATFGTVALSRHAA